MMTQSTPAELNLVPASTEAPKAEPLTYSITPSVPAGGEQIVSKKHGTITGHRYFLGTVPASVLREQFKALGFSGNDLKAKVNQALGDEASSRKIAAFASIEFAHKEKGMLPDVCEIRKSSGVIKLVSGGILTDTAATKRAAELAEQNAKLLAERLETKNAMEAMQKQIAELVAAAAKSVRK